MSIGLTLIFGVLRVVNFAHGEFLMLGMYGAWALSTMAGLNPYTAALIVVPAMFLFGGAGPSHHHQSRARQAASRRRVRDHGSVDLHAERRADDDDGRPLGRAAGVRQLGHHRPVLLQGRTAARLRHHHPLHRRRCSG